MKHCAMCHGLVGERGVYPDLRRLDHARLEIFDAIVRGGALQAVGMASFADVLSPDQAVSIRSYVIDWAQRSRRGEQNQSATGGIDEKPDSARSKGL
jgi:mono/diheme cytochrome c family protein